jgi:hypothetical protein
MLTDPTPRPPRCYDPTTAPHHEAGAGQIHDHRTVRGLLRDPQRVRSDVTEMLTPEQRDHLHPVSSFVWATDRKTIIGCPGRHAPARSSAGSPRPPGSWSGRARRPSGSRAASSTRSR